MREIQPKSSDHRFSIRAAALAATLLLALTLGCQGEKTPVQPAGAENPEQEEATRTGLEIIAPSATILSEMGALYLRITNHDAVADRLLRVETSAAEMAEIHSSTEEDGVVRMRHQAEGLEIAPGATLELTQGGSHIMLMGATLPATDPVIATLYFERAGAVEISAPLASLDDMGAAGQEDHAGHGEHAGH